jgi:hypothetical protein
MMKRISWGWLIVLEQKRSARDELVFSVTPDIEPPKRRMTVFTRKRMRPQALLILAARNALAWAGVSGGEMRYCLIL